MALAPCAALISTVARADAHTDVHSIAAAPAAHPDSAASTPESELDAIRSQLERAEFQLAEARLRTLLAGPLDARARNAALELKAVLALAARKDHDAQAALGELYARDPGHASRVSELGPQVAAAFERVAHTPPAPVPVSVRVGLTRGVDGRPQLVLALDDAAQAVDSLHTFIRYAGEARYTQLLLDARSELALTIPEPGAETGVLSTYVEARAPSGALLAQEGGAEAPLSIEVRALARATPCPAPVELAPLRRQWWLWTSVGVVAAAIISSSVIATR